MGTVIDGRQMSSRVSKASCNRLRVSSEPRALLALPSISLMRFLICAWSGAVSRRDASPFGLVMRAADFFRAGDFRAGNFFLATLSPWLVGPIPESRSRVFGGQGVER